VTYREEDIAFEKAPYFVLRVPTGYEVYRSGVVAATRCARIGYKGDVGLERAKAEIARREALEP
jgi:hypothetical protein